MKAVVVLSGGIDSTVLLHYVASLGQFKEIFVITFNYGQRLVREIDCAEWQVNQSNYKNVWNNVNPLIKDHKVIDLRFFKELSGISSLTNIHIAVPTAAEVLGDAQSSTYVPNRNMIMLSIAAAYAESQGAEKVFYGAQGADKFSGYYDAQPEFLTAINNVLCMNRKNQIKIEAPFVDWDKETIIAKGIELEVDFRQTHTCYEGTEIACGKCVSDANRIQAFMNIGYIDPVPYAINIPWTDYGCKSLPYLK